MAVSANLQKLQMVLAKSGLTVDAGMPIGCLKFPVISTSSAPIQRVQKRCNRCVITGTCVKHIQLDNIQVCDFRRSNKNKMQRFLVYRDPVKNKIKILKKL